MRTPSPQRPQKRLRTLAPPATAKRRFGSLARNPARANPNLTAETDFEYSEPGDASSDATTSSEPAQARRERLLQARSTRRRRLMAAAAAHPTMAQLSLLERVTVKSSTERSYEDAMTKLLEFCNLHDRRLVEDSEVDEEIVRYFNDLFGKGKPAHEGEVCMAALMHFVSRFSKMGEARLPRAWRALKGWRRRAPSRSRIAYPLPVWAGIIWALCLGGHWSMGAYLLWLITTYNRPSEPLAVLRRDLFRPMSGVSQDWTVLLWPEERDGRSKVLGSDDSLSLNNKIVPWFTEVVAALADGPEEERIFNFSYAEFSKEFTRARRKLRIKRLVPYQARHSGASIDLCNHYRSIAEVKSRGRWASEKSMLRYNKAAKLAQSMKPFDRRQLEFFEAADKHLEGLFSGKVPPESIPLP